MTITTKNIRYVNLTESTTLAGYIAETCVRANKLKDRIQVASVGILMHVGTHNNKPQAVKFANNLCDGLGQGIQVKALIDWFIEFGMVVAEDGKSFGDVNLEKVKANFQKAKATHWVTFAPITPWSGFKLEDKLVQLFKGADDAQERANKSAEEAQVVNIDNNKLAMLKVIAGMDATQLQALAATMGGVSVDESVDISATTEDFTAGLVEEEEVQAA